MKIETRSGEIEGGSFKKIVCDNGCAWIRFGNGVVVQMSFHNHFFKQDKQYHIEGVYLPEEMCEDEHMLDIANRLGIVSYEEFDKLNLEFKEEAEEQISRKERIEYERLKLKFTN